MVNKLQNYFCVSFDEFTSLVQTFVSFINLKSFYKMFLVDNFAIFFDFQYNVFSENCRFFVLVQLAYFQKLVSHLTFVVFSVPPFFHFDDVSRIQGLFAPSFRHDGGQKPECRVHHGQMLPSPLEESIPLIKGEVITPLRLQ